MLSSSSSLSLSLPRKKERKKGVKVKGFVSKRSTFCIYSKRSYKEDELEEAAVKVFNFPRKKERRMMALPSRRRCRNYDAVVRERERERERDASVCESEERFCI